MEVTISAWLFEFEEELFLTTRYPGVLDDLVPEDIPSLRIYDILSTNITELHDQLNSGLAPDSGDPLKVRLTIKVKLNPDL